MTTEYCIRISFYIIWFFSFSVGIGPVGRISFSSPRYAMDTFAVWHHTKSLQQGSGVTKLLKWLTLSPLLPPYISYHLMSPYITLYHLISPHITLYHLISPFNKHHKSTPETPSDRPKWVSLPSANFHGLVTGRQHGLCSHHQWARGEIQCGLDCQGAISIPKSHLNQNHDSWAKTNHLAGPWEIRMPTGRRAMQNEATVHCDHCNFCRRPLSLSELPTIWHITSHRCPATWRPCLTEC